MLEVKPNTDIKLLAGYCKKCDPPKAPGPQHYLYLATDKSRLLAAGLFEISPSRVDVLLYEADEFDAHLLDAVLRAGLNYAAGHGITIGCLSEEFKQLHSALFAQLNYPIQSEFGITNFFAKYKNCR